MSQPGRQESEGSRVPLAASSRTRPEALTVTWPVCVCGGGGGAALLSVLYVSPAGLTQNVSSKSLPRCRLRREKPNPRIRMEEPASEALLSNVLSVGSLTRNFAWWTFILCKVKVPATASHPCCEDWLRAAIFNHFHLMTHELLTKTLGHTKYVIF